MSEAAAQLDPPDLNEKPLDGSVGGALDIAGQGEIDPESTDNINDGRGQVVKPQLGEELNSEIMEALEKIEDLEGQRSGINSQISAVIQDIESKGVNRHAFRLALKYHKMDEKQREGLDFSYTLARNAIGMPIQAELFDVNATSVSDSE